MGVSETNRWITVVVVSLPRKPIVCYCLLISKVKAFAEEGKCVSYVILVFSCRLVVGEES